MVVWNKCFYICGMTNKTTISIPEQVKVALDGRTQRWLAMEIKMPEDMLSKKMNGFMEFSNEDIKTINHRLKSNIKL